MRKRMVRRRRLLPRRRFVRRKLSRFRRKRDVGITTQSGIPRSDFRRGRLQRKRVFKSRQFKDTDFKAKYGSILTENITVNTPASINQKAIFPQSMYLYTNPFWQVNGGAYARDNGALPGFDDKSIFIRGGKAELRVSNPATNTQAAEIEVATFFTKPNANLSAISSGTVDRAYDVTMAPFSFDCGRLMSRKKVLLKPGECSVFVHFFRPQKILKQDYLNNFRSPDWFVSLSNLNNNGAMGINFNLSYNISFVGDADIPIAPA